MYRVEDPVFAMAESSFLDGGSRLDDVALDPLTTFSGRRPVATPDSQLPDVGRCPVRRVEISKIARNHILSGLCVFSSSVPDIRLVW